jgi:fibronectin type 3 domain-containing protein
LKRPDVVPPSAAVMDDYKVTATGVELHWVPSSSEDLSKTVLYRKDEKSTVWKEIASYRVDQKSNSFTDTTGLLAGKIYSYSLVAFDEDGLQSKRSVPIKIRYTDFKSRQAVKTISAKANDKVIFVNWNYPVKGEFRFILYRAVNGSAFDSYKSLSGNINAFSDKDVRKGSKYEYSVGVVYKDGKKAPFGSIATTSF